VKVKRTELNGFISTNPSGTYEEYVEGIRAWLRSTYMNKRELYALGNERDPNPSRGKRQPL